VVRLLCVDHRECPFGFEFSVAKKARICR